MQRILYVKINKFFEANDSDLPLVQSSLEFELYKNITDTFDTFLENITTKSSKQNLCLVETDKDIVVHPHDIGVGISQVLPILVAVLNQKNPILAIEQPELHIHPAMQVELADLFIEGYKQ